MSEDSREENVYMAKLAEQAERYDEVCEYLLPSLLFAFIITSALRVGKALQHKADNTRETLLHVGWAGWGSCCHLTCKFV
eukprot:1309597-Rhodomonas_salina.2